MTTANLELATLLPEAWEHATGTTDEAFQTGESTDGFLAAVRRATVGGFWLPKGHHFDLHIEHRPLENSGSMTGGGHKWVWHTTESDWDQVDLMYQVLKAKRAAPHFVIGKRKGLKHPVVIQMVALNRAGRSLQHVFGPETNRANAVQAEICGRAAESGEWHEWRYKALANLVRLTTNTMPRSHNIPWHEARKFYHTNKFTPEGFVHASGHCGHIHVPGNDHVDPGVHFRGDLLVLKLLHHMPKHGYDL